MIDRYILNKDKLTVKRRYDIEEDFDLKETFNAVPTDYLPIIRNTTTKTISHHYWGQTPSWSKNKRLSNKLFNASTKDLYTKKSLSQALNQRRCIIPATGFVTWNQLGKKTTIPYLYHLPTFELFSMAGVWEEFTTLDEQSYITYKLFIFFDEKVGVYFPWIIPKNEEMDWLADQSDKIGDPTNPEIVLKSYSISPVIHKTQLDDESMIKHVPPVDQRGNYTLFS